MANNTTLNAMSGGDVIADEDISGVKYQFVKLADGTAASTTVIKGDANGLWVVPRNDVLRIATNSGGLTTATTAYTAGDQVGTQFTMASASRVSGGTGTLHAVTLTSAADIIGAYDVVITRSSITLAADNAVYAISDTDALAIVSMVQLVGAFDIGNNRIAQQQNLDIQYDCNGGTSLYASLICRLGHTFFAAVTDLQLTFWVERD